VPRAAQGAALQIPGICGVDFFYVRLFPAEDRVLVATGHLWQLMWIFSTWITLLFLEYRKKE